MNERLLQFIWKFQYFNQCSLTTASCEDLVIISPGSINNDQGPDFSSARIKINGQEWSGSIELHVNSSDWLLHKHDDDINYRQVILHVVWKDDGSPIDIPLLELEPRVPSHLLDTYLRWMNLGEDIPCSKSIRLMEPNRLYSWLDWLSYRRLVRKSTFILDKVKALNMNWEQAFWQSMARSFGHRVNADSFERIAASIPVNTLIRHGNSIVQMEALLLGQAGLLQPSGTDQYPKMLYREFSFLKKKYNLPELHEPVYFLRMRPINFPTIRLAQLAAVFYENGNLFAKVSNAVSLEDIYNLLRVCANDYWHYRYRFDEPSPFKEKRTGQGLIDIVLINTVIPFLYAYYTQQSMDEKADHYASLLMHISAEQNSVVYSFTRDGIKTRHASDTQALKECKRFYCEEFQCLKCGIGRYLLKHLNSQGQLK